MGAITPLGNDVETLWNNLINGVCGIDYITKIDTTDVPVKIAAEVKSPGTTGAELHVERTWN